jgi:microcystin-dependent protein
MPYAGSSAPTGWLLCNGAAVSRTTYADLFTAISTTFGTGDGSTTFNLPDCTGRVIAGKEAAATRLTSAVSGVDGATLGSASGSQSHTLTIPELPVVTPAGTIGNTV